LHFDDKQTDRQTDKQKQMDSPNALSRSRCRERRLNNRHAISSCSSAGQGFRLMFGSLSGDPYIQRRWSGRRHLRAYTRLFSFYTTEGRLTMPTRLLETHFLFLLNPVHTTMHRSVNSAIE